MSTGTKILLLVFLLVGFVVGYYVSQRQERAEVPREEPVTQSARFGVEGNALVQREHRVLFLSVTRGDQIRWEPESGITEFKISVGRYPMTASGFEEPDHCKNAPECPFEGARTGEGGKCTWERIRGQQMSGRAKRDVRLEGCWYKFRITAGEYKPLDPHIYFHDGKGS